MADTTAAKVSDLVFDKQDDGTFIKWKAQKTLTDLKALQDASKAIEADIKERNEVMDILKTMPISKRSILRSVLGPWPGMKVKTPETLLQESIDLKQKELDAMTATLQKEKP